MANMNLVEGGNGVVAFPDLFISNAINDKLADGDNEAMLGYLNWLGMARSQNFMLLSPRNHFYYDEDDFRNVDVVMNLRHLNHIKQVREYLYSICNLLPRRSILVGSFIDRKSRYQTTIHRSKDQYHTGSDFDPYENGIGSKIPLVNLMYNLLDARTNRVLTRRTVGNMLESLDMRVLDMSERKDITYFSATPRDIRQAAGKFD